MSNHKSDFEEEDDAFTPYSKERDHMGRLLSNRFNHFSPSNQLRYSVKKRRLPSVYEFNKRWSVNRQPTFSNQGLYESREVKYSINLDCTITPSANEPKLLANYLSSKVTVPSNADASTNEYSNTNLYPTPRKLPDSSRVKVILEI